MAQPLNPVTIFSTDASGNPSPVSAAAPLPATTGTETAAAVPTVNPDSGTVLTEAALLRGLLAAQRDVNSSLRDLVSEVRVHSALLGIIAGVAPEDYRT